MSFQSILYKNGPPDRVSENMPAFFTDLHLDQVVDKMTEGKDEYHLKPFFYTGLQDADSILYRQQVMKELESPDIRLCVETFARAMQQIRKMLQHSRNCPYPYQRERLFLDAVARYCNSIGLLHQQLQALPLKSDGLYAFRQYLSDYIASEIFTTINRKSEKILNELGAVTYDLHTEGLTVRVLPCQPQPDYSEVTEQLYSRFRVPGAKDYTKPFPFTTDMNHVEAEILKGVATLFPELFQSLCDFFTSNQNFTDDFVLAFDREIQFYIACLHYCEKIKAHGAPFCYPEITATAGKVYAHETFDIALAYKLAEQNQPLVRNDFMLSGEERVIIVSGPNQGGKTTFARTFGQLHYLACLGCPVPGNAVQVMLFDAIYTHFEREEDIATHRSKFEEDLVRIHAIMQAASGQSVIILNEIFSSTTLQDALFLCRKIMQHLIRLNAYCIWVTFIDELVTLSDTAVSMESTVVPGNPAARTFKVIRKAPDGMAYALSIAEKYRVTYKQLKERIHS